MLAVSGLGIGAERSATEGQSFTVGRTERADLSIPEDHFLSALHFSIGYHEGKAHLRDLGSSNGTKLNGGPITLTSLNDGDVIYAGATIFLVRFRSGVLAPVSPLDLLSSQPEPVYAILDGARDPSIYPFVVTCGMPYCSLYRGSAESNLESVAPYLVALPQGSEAMANLVAKGWANAWGIFLTCGQSLEEVRKQLRRSLKVSIEYSSEQMYFRFYDPRVLRLFLPLAEAAQFEEFAGPITSFLMEAEEESVMLKFHRHGSSVWADRISVKSPERPTMQESR